MKKIILKVEGMSCSACSNGLEKYLKKQKGIHEASVNLVLAQASIQYDDSLTISDLNRFIEEAGFESSGEWTLEESKKKEPILFVTILFLFFLYVTMGGMIHLPSLPFLSMEKNPEILACFELFMTLAFLYYGKDILKSGFKNVIHRTPNMDTLVSLGVLASLGYSLYYFFPTILGSPHYLHHLYFESVVMVIYFIKLGRFLDGKSKEKTKEALKELVQITPQKALLKKGDKEIEVTIDEVQKGDLLIAKPGQKIAVDGIIKKGSSHLEQAFITGESVPEKKEVGEEVIAGSVNIDGYLEYEAVRIGKDSTISEIVRLVVEASNSKAPIGRLADKVSGYFVPFILGIALLTLIVSLLLSVPLEEAFTSFVTVLVVACPCALGLATPLAMVVSVGRCAKEGILIKSSETLEATSKIDTIIFDKTGTLTYGNLQVFHIYTSVEEKKVKQIVMSLEKYSNHPISQAFKTYEKEFSLLEVTDFQNLPGMGIEGVIDGKKYQIGNEKLVPKKKYEKEASSLMQEGCSLLYVIEEGEVIALFGVKDIVREYAKETIDALKKMGKEVIMLTGDNEKTASLIASSLAIDSFVADVLPKEKTEEVQKLLDQGKKVMMVGDGINDAPSLTLATVGVSVLSGSDIATDSSDVILVHDDISKLPKFFQISKRTILNIQENLFWAFFYNLLMIPIAMGLLKPIGLSMNPMIASLAMTISSLTVVLNALRLRGGK